MSGGANYANTTRPTYVTSPQGFMWVRTNQGSGTGNRFVRYTLRGSKLTYAQGSSVFIDLQRLGGQPARRGDVDRARRHRLRRRRRPLLPGRALRAAAVRPQAVARQTEPGGHTVRVPARDRLDEYKRKRDPQRTPEPAGDGDGATARGDGNRFVVQEHHATRLHWDLRLEHDGVAASWAIPNGIPEDPKENRLAVRTEDHPLEYLEFEGDIPKGEYGAGKMRIWDRGTYETHKFDDEKVEITFHGERLHGRYGLFPLKKRKGEPPGKDWMIHRMDPAEDPTREPMPERLVPMLAKPSPAGLPPDDDRWAYEIKWDGVRALAYSEPGRIRFESRNRNDITNSYPELKALNRALSSHKAILDGEIVAFDENGRPSFGRLQGRMHIASEAAARRRMKDTPVVYVVFDLLWLDGHSLMELPYEERRARLQELELQGPHWQTPDHVVGNGAAVLAASLENGLEGVVAKQLDSPYLPGRRSPCWLKVKNVLREDVVVGGWLPGEGKRRERIGALLVGVPDEGRLRYAGRVGTGFTEKELDRLAKMLEQREDSPFGGEPQPPRHAVYVEPTRVAEVEFTEWTTDGMMRHPSYKGLREEAPPSAFLDAGTPVRDGIEVKVGGRTLKVTNLDKVMYPKVGFTQARRHRVLHRDRAGDPARTSRAGR